MSTLATFENKIVTNLTPQGGGDTIDGSEMRDTFEFAKILFQERGVVVKPDTASLASLPSTETTIALVEAVGLFTYSANGLSDNVNIFPAQNGGVWIKRISQSALNAELTALGNITPQDGDIIQRVNGAWVNRTIFQLRQALAVDQVPNLDFRNPANIQQNANFRLVTDVMISAWNAKQNQLISGQNIKTINGQSPLGPGDISVSNQGTVVTDANPQPGSTNPVQSNGVAIALLNKRDRVFVTKTAHGWTAGIGVYVDSGGVWQKSDGATNGAAKAVTGVIISVPDANTFELGRAGDIFPFTGGIGIYYLKPTPGSGVNYQTAEPSTVGQWSKILFVAHTNNQASVVNEWGYEVQTPDMSLLITNGSVTDAMLAAAVKHGDNANLTTNYKTDTVGALNEINAKVNGLQTVSSGADQDYNSLPPLSNPGSFAVAVISSTQINLSWTDISGELNYVLQRSTTANANYSTIATPAADSTSYNDTALQPDTHYYYRLKAKGDSWTTGDSQFVFANARTSTGGSAPTIEQSIFLNFTNPYISDTVYSDVQTINDVGGTAVANGTAAKNAVKDITGATTTVNFALTSPGLQSAGAPLGGTDPNNNTVFGKENVANYTWYLANGTTFRLSGLTPSRTYRIYFWSHSQPWESAVVTFTGTGTGSATTTQATTGNNIGDAAGSPLLDQALRMIEVVSTSGGVIDFTAHNISGFNAVPLTAIYLQRLSS